MFMGMKSLDFDHPALAIVAMVPAFMLGERTSLMGKL
jgi:hypothetical protein